MNDLPGDMPLRAKGVIVGAAVGDALGWPQEDRSSIVGGQKARNVKPDVRFRQWDRYTGGQFAKYVETIHAGEYSDDTELLLATGRACLHGDDWWRWLTEVELPAWLLYQRGGGRAVLGASRAWAEHCPPWRAPAAGKRVPDPRRYFGAGSNGAAMRIAPHALVSVADSTPDAFLVRLVNDALCTHGHPRAIMGAVIHGLVLWNAIRRAGTLNYGDLVQGLLDDTAWRGAAKDLFAAAPEDWVDAYEQIRGERLEDAWTMTVHETEQLLTAAQSAVDRAAMANDEATLERLGCFDKSRAGAGTVSAVAATYLASRNAARPMGGLLRAAFLKRADTDTLASMTASVLGAVHGTQWLGSMATDVQDAGYLHYLTESVVTRRADRRPADGSLPLVDVKAIDRFREAVTLGGAMPKTFVDERPVQDVEREQMPLRGKGFVTRARLRLEDGQLLVIDKLSKPRTTSDSAPPTASKVVQGSLEFTGSGRATARTAIPVRITLRVKNLGISLRFYSEVLGLTALRNKTGDVSLSDWLSLRELADDRNDGDTSQGAGDVLLTLQVDDFEAAVARARNSDLGKIIRVDIGAPLPHMRLRDPDGHHLLIEPQPSGS